MPFESEFIEQVIAASVPRYAETKADIVAYYQEKYGSRWRQPLQHALVPITGLKENSLKRRFDPSRLGDTPSRKAAKEYRELGRQIGPIDYQVPTNGYEITFQGSIRISNKCFPRQFIIHVTGAEAKEMLLEAAENAAAAYEIMFREYFEGDDVAEGYCADPEIVIQPWGEKSVKGRPSTPHKPRTAYAKR